MPETVQAASTFDAEIVANARAAIQETDPMFSGGAKGARTVTGITVFTPGRLELWNVRRVDRSETAYFVRMETTRSFNLFLPEHENTVRQNLTPAELVKWESLRARK